MKRVFTKLTVLLLAGAALLFTGCSKDNTEKPAVTPSGEYVTKAEFEAMKSSYEKDIQNLGKTIADLETVLNGRIAALDLRVTNLESAVSKQ